MPERIGLGAETSESVATSVTSLLAAAATLYGLLGACSSLLQARRMARRNRSADVSLGFLATITGGYLIWLLYGISISNIPLIAVDSAGLACGSLTCLIALRLRRIGAVGPPPASTAAVPEHA
jgi:uncharacterized protein with PQ loop repeat